MTVGTGDAWPGTTPKSVGSVRLDAKTSAPEDLNILTSITDVRCIGDSAPGFCAAPNTDNTGVPDYSGELSLVLVFRRTDNYNCSFNTGTCQIPNANGGPSGPAADPATSQDFAFPVTVPCTATTDTTVGATCAVNTTANAVVPSFILDFNPYDFSTGRTNFEVQTINVYDGGADGDGDSQGDNTLFETQGIWIP